MAGIAYFMPRKLVRAGLQHQPLDDDAALLGEDVRAFFATVC